MRAVSVKEILDITEGKLVCGRADHEVRNFSLDSRAIKCGDMFIAIKGTRFDGHGFLEEVINKGVSGIIIEEGYALPECLSRLPSYNGKRNLLPIVIRVRNTIEALGNIAYLYRKRFQGPVIAVTGTVGKTGTKEVIAAVLAQKFRVHKNKGTFNNHIGVPITLMGLDSQFDVAAIELGMNRFGEIRNLAAITQPDVGIITNIGPAHLEYFGTVDNIAKAKAELLEVLEKDKLVILNRDDNYYVELKNAVRSRLISVGKDLRSDFQAVDLTLNKDGYPKFKIIAKPFNEILEVTLPVIGLHNVYSALIAAVVGYGLGLRPDEIINGLMKISLPEMRLELRSIAGIRIMNDCYNANPVSMASAVDTLARLEITGRRILVCGDMLELGKDAPMFHRDLGNMVVEFGIDRLVTIGNLSRLVSRGAIENGMSSLDIRDCENNIEAVEVLVHWLEPGDVILIKGSRANHLEQIVNGIEEYYTVLEQIIV